MVRTLDDITKDTVEALRGVVDANDETTSTEMRKKAAACFVEVREHFVTADGSPDWAAKTHAYRGFSADVYALAGISGTDAQVLRGSMRYHVGNAVRDRLSADELEAYGLTASRPRERMAAIRKGQTKRLSSVGAGATFQASDDIVNMLSLMSTTVSRVRPEVVGAFAPAERVEVVRRLRQLSAQLTGIADEATLS
jgi:hypothetical protein